MIDQTGVWKALGKVIDPEIGLSVTDLGLIYRTSVNGGTVEIDFTLTYPGCPLGGIIRDEIENAVSRIDGVEAVDARLVWEPQWSPAMMSEEIRFSFGYPV